MLKTKLNLGKRAFSVAARRVWNELPITLKTSETIAIFLKKPQDVFIPNCISTINLRLSLVLTITLARPYSRLCLMIVFLLCLSAPFPEDIGAILLLLTYNNGRCMIGKCIAPLLTSCYTQTDISVMLIRCKNPDTTKYATMQVQQFLRGIFNGLLLPGLTQLHK